MLSYTKGRNGGKQNKGKAGNEAGNEANKERKEKRKEEWRERQKKGRITWFVLM